MKTFGRRTLAAILSVIMVLSCFAGLTFSVGAQISGKTSGDYEYFVESYGDVRITKYIGNELDVVIPDEIDGRNVDSIDQYSFYGLNLNSITIPDSIIYLADSSFSNLSLNEINVSEENKRYKSVDGILFNKDMTKILLYPNKRVGEYVIPNSVEILSGTFRGCKGLTGITIPSGVIDIPSEAFEDCTSLTNVTIPDSVQKIGSYAFFGCTSLTNVTIPYGIKTIKDKTFSKCSNLISITIPDSVTEIGYYAFSECTGLTSVMIPDSVEKIDSYAFLGCSQLKSINVSDNNENYKSSDGVLFNKDMTAILCYPNKHAEEYVIPNSVEMVASDAFQGCDELTTITIPGSVKTICSYGFDECTELTSVTIYDGVKEIEFHAFNKCNNLVSITMPDSIEFVSGDAFAYCSQLESINISDNNETYKSSDGILFNKDMTEIIAYPGARKGEYTIPDSVEEIGESAFQGCIGITSVKMPDSVTKIDSFAFYDCVNLANVKISKSVGYIDSHTFNGCIGLTSIIIPGSVRFIYDGAFSGCTNLASVTIVNDASDWYGFGGIGEGAFEECASLISIKIPDRFNSISGGAFRNCSQLESINVSENNEKYKSFDGVLFNKDMTNIIACPGARIGEYTIPDSVNEIGYCAFEGCTGLTSVKIPDSVTGIGSAAFQGCTGLTDIIITDNVTSIGMDAFLNCSKIKKVTIPKSISSSIRLCGFGLDDGGINSISGFTIYGYPHTEAENYAFLYDFKFVDLAPNSHSDIGIRGEKPATCTENGYSGDKYCELYNAFLESGTEIPALGHSEVTIKGKSATCTEKGLTDGVKCSVCGEVIKAQKEIAATGHKFNKGACTVCGAIDPDYKVVLESVSENIKVDNKSKAAVFIPASSSGMKIAEFKNQFDGEISVNIDDNSLVANGTKFKFRDNEFTVIVKGDVQADGKITASDARTILRISAKLDRADDAGMSAADVNGDGKVTAGEARRVLRFSAKLEKSISN